MTIAQTRILDDATDILAVVDEAVRMLQQEDVEPRYVVVGPQAYDALNAAIARRFNRQPGTFESYQWLSIVLDPFRGPEVCVLPAPQPMVGGVRVERR